MQVCDPSRVAKDQMSDRSRISFAFLLQVLQARSLNVLAMFDLLLCRSFSKKTSRVANLLLRWWFCGKLSHSLKIWRDGRVVEGAALEMLFTRKGNQGSNPCLSVLKARQVKIWRRLKLNWYRNRIASHHNIIAEPPHSIARFQSINIVPTSLFQLPLPLENTWPF